jgi:hypothetical protein
MDYVDRSASYPRVLKDSTEKLASGGVLEFEQSGGTAQIGAVTVDALVPWQMPMVPRRNYLYCQVNDGDGKFWSAGALEIGGNGMLQRMTRAELSREPQSPRDPDELELVGAQNAIAMIEAEVHNPNRTPK